MKKVFEEFKNQLTNEIPERKQADFKQEKEILKEYNGRQLLELLQNIDDQKSKEALIHLDTKNQTILIANSGEPFSEKGLKSLMMAHLSPKDKTFIGNKGLGFRSLLNWAGEIYVKSKNLSIEFSKNNRDRLQINGKRAILSSPEWINESNPREWIKKINFSNENITTYIVIHYKKEIEKYIIEQLENISEELLFFINHIEEINIRNNKEKIFKKKFWKIVKEEHLLPNYLQDEEKEYYQIKIAFPPNNEPVSEFLFSYFPTNIKISFPVLIHTTFDLDSSRNTIVDSLKNRFVVKKLAYFIIKTAKELKEDISNWKAYEFLNISHKNEILEKFGFYKIIEDWKETADIYPCIDNKYRNLKSVSFYNNNFSNFMEYHSEFLENIVKSNNYISNYDVKHSSHQLVMALSKISEKKLLLNERIDLIKNVITLKNDRKDLIPEKLTLLINQDKILKEELFFYTNIFISLPIPNFIDINYVYPPLQQAFDNNNLSIISEVKYFDIEEDLINKIIISNETIQVKLKSLYFIFQYNNRLEIPSERLDEIYSKYLRDERVLNICDEESIIREYEYLGINKYKNLDKFLLWLGAKKFNSEEILKKVIKQNNQKNNIQKSLKSLFLLKDELEDNGRIKTVETIFVLDGNSVVSDITTLFPYKKECEKENIIASKNLLGLGEYSYEKVQEFLEWLKIKEFNPDNIALERINLLKKKDIDREKSKLIFKFLFNSKERQEIHFSPETDNIFIFGKLSNSLVLRNNFTEKYFTENELIFNYDKLSLRKSESTDDFLKWLGVKEATDNQIVKKIFASKIDAYKRIKDLVLIYNHNNKIILPDIKFELLNKNLKLVNVQDLYLNNETSKFCKNNKVVSRFHFDVDENFLEWLGLSPVSRKDLVERFLELLSEINLGVDNRKEIILLLSNKYNKEEKRDEEGFLFLLNNKDEIKKSSELYQETDSGKKHIPNDLINSDLKLDKDFLEWLGVKEPNPKKIIKTLLRKEKINYLDIFEIWSENSSKVGKSLNDNHRLKIQAPKLFNRDRKYILANNLFLKKEETPFYTNTELVAEFKDLGLDDCKINEVEDFLVWLGVNSYIKYEEENDFKKVYKLTNISKLKFDKLILLLEKENILENRGALKYLQNKIQKHKYWILKDYGISLINPLIEYENNSNRIELLRQFGIKEDFNERNSLFLLQKLFEIDKEGKFSPKIYKKLLDKSLIFRDESLKLFTKNKNYKNNKLLFYLDNSEQPKFIQNQYSLIDLPINLDIKKIINTFGVKKFPTFYYKVLNFKEIDSSKFYSYFNKLKEYFLVFGTLESNASDEKKIAEKLNTLNIKFGTFDCFSNNNKIELEEFEMIYSNNIFYINSNHIEDNFFKDLNLTNSIENILLTINFKDNSKFRNIFRNSDFEEYNKEINEKYGSSILEDARNLLYNKEEDILIPKIIPPTILDKEDFIDNSIQNFRNVFDKMPENIKNSSTFNEMCDRFTTSLEKEYKHSYREIDYSRFSKEEQDNFKREAGEKAEEVVKKYFPQYKQVSGYAEGGDDRLGYDFEYIIDTEKHFVEVKNFSNLHYKVSDNEMKIAKEKGDKYHIYLVYGEDIYDIGNIFDNKIKISKGK
jgi:hypothetical protein